MKKLKSIFWGTPNVAVKALDELSKHSTILAVICNPDKVAGRKKELTPPPVKKWVWEWNKDKAANKKIQLLQPRSVKDDSFLSSLKSLGTIDFALVCAYGKILPENLIELPLQKTINIHFSLLPKWRGASPVEASLLAGDTTTGVSFQFINKKMDEGDIILQKEISLSPFTHAKDLFIDLENLLPNMTKELVSLLTSKQYSTKKQDHSKASYCKKIATEDGLIDWSESAEKIYHNIQALYLRKGVYSYHKNKRIKFLWGMPGSLLNQCLIYKDKKPDQQKNVKCPKGNILISHLEYSTKIELTSTEQENSIKIKPGQILGLWNNALLIKVGQVFEYTSKNKELIKIEIPVNEILYIRLLQPEGKKVLFANDFFNGSRLEWGDEFKS